MGQPTDESENLLLTILCAVDLKLNKAIDDIANLKRCVTSLETNVALLHGDFAGQSPRLDGIDQCLESIERALNITPT